MRHHHDLALSSKIDVHHPSGYVLSDGCPPIAGPRGMRIRTQEAGRLQRAPSAGREYLWERSARIAGAGDYNAAPCAAHSSLVSSAGGRSTASARSASASGRQSFLCAKGHSLCELLTMARRRCLLPGSNAISRKREAGTRTGFDRHCDRRVLLGPLRR